MTYAVSRLRPLLFDKLPSDVKPHVRSLDRYWLTAEAASVYARAAAVVSMEQHSPIMAIAAGTPAILVRQPTDTRKGQMWRDIGLDRWIFEIDDSTGRDRCASGGGRPRPDCRQKTGRQGKSLRQRANGGNDPGDSELTLDVASQIDPQGGLCVINSPPHSSHAGPCWS